MGFSQATWKQYWPLMGNIVHWLKSNHESTGQDLHLEEGKLMQYMEDLKSGKVKHTGALI